MRHGKGVWTGLTFAMRISGFIGNAPRLCAGAIWAVVLSSIAMCSPSLRGAGNPSGASPVEALPGAQPAPLAEMLGIHFVQGSSSTLLMERDGKTYLVDLSSQTIRESLRDSPAPAATAAHLEPARSSPPQAKTGGQIFASNCATCHGTEGKGGGPLRTPDFTNPAVQATLSQSAATKTIREGKPGTAMPAWEGKLADAEIQSVATFVKSLGQGGKTEQGTNAAAATQIAKVYTPADDYVFSLPTGRKLDRHGLYLNFTHRFPYTPAFSGPGNMNTLFGLDDFAIPSFGLRYGVTDKLSVSAYRSPSIIDRPIELGVAYNFLDEHQGHPLNAVVRASIDGQGNFAKNFTENLELIVSRTVTQRAQLYFVPTLSLNDRELMQKNGTLASSPPNVPGYNTFSLGFGGALNIRPTVALVSEVIPTLANGAELGVHRPAYAFGIQKRVLRHAFTLGFSTSPGTVVSQRAGTRAAFLGQPSADTPSGLFIGFDLMRQIY
jgi:mono/diheme cytochrome c family protein